MLLEGNDRREPCIAGCIEESSSHEVQNGIVAIETASMMISKVVTQDYVVIIILIRFAT